MLANVSLEKNCARRMEYHQVHLLVHWVVAHSVVEIVAVAGPVTGAAVVTVVVSGRLAGAGRPEEGYALLDIQGHHGARLVPASVDISIPKRI